MSNTPEKVTGLAVLTQANLTQGRLNTPRRKYYSPASEVGDASQSDLRAALFLADSSFPEALVRSAHPLEDQLPPGTFESVLVSKENTGRDWVLPQIKDIYTKMVAQASPENNLGVARAMQRNADLARRYRADDMGIFINSVIHGDKVSAFPIVGEQKWVLYPADLTWGVRLADFKKGRLECLRHSILYSDARQQWHGLEDSRILDAFGSALSQAAGAFDKSTAFEMIWRREGVTFVQAKSTQALDWPRPTHTLSEKEAKRIVWKQAMTQSAIPRIETAHPFCVREELPVLLWNTGHAEQDASYRKKVWNFAVETERYFLVETGIPGETVAPELLTMRQELIKHAAASLTAIYGLEGRRYRELTHENMPIAGGSAGSLGLLHREAPGWPDPHSCRIPFSVNNGIKQGEYVTVFSGNSVRGAFVAGYILTPEQFKRVYPSGRPPLCEVW